MHVPKNIIEQIIFKQKNIIKQHNVIWLLLCEHQTHNMIVFIIFIRLNLFLSFLKTRYPIQ